MGSLFAIMAISMAIATFIEHRQGIETARVLIYNARWFELLMLLFALNFVLNIKTYRLSARAKWPTLILHLALVIIILGASVTRYIGFEGMMSLREGQVSDQIVLDETVLSVHVKESAKNNGRRWTIEKPLLLSGYTPRLNHFIVRTKLSGKNFEIEYQEFVPDFEQNFVQSESGESYLKLVLLKGTDRLDFYLKDGQAIEVNGQIYSLNLMIDGAINFESLNGQLFMIPPAHGTSMNMTTFHEQAVLKNQKILVNLKSLYTFGRQEFVIPEPLVVSKLNYLSKQIGPNDIKTDDVLLINLKLGNEQKTLSLIGGARKLGIPKTVEMDGFSVTLAYGSKTHTLPFKLGLKDFIAKKYPGTINSYSSFESRVFVASPKTTFPYEIYMNHVLDFEGYRFFQSSFHPDEKGTILSINHDWLGTRITYLGYGLLYLGLLALLFSKDSRFRKAAAQLKAMKVVSLVIFSCLIFNGKMTHAQERPISQTTLHQKIDSLVLASSIPLSQARDFAEMVIQDGEGRMKPVNTFSSELLRKISKKESYNGLNSDQVLIDLIRRPQVWYNVPLIAIKSENDSLKNMLGLGTNAHHAPLSVFFNSDEEYILARSAAQAYQSVLPNQFEKDIIEVDKKVNLLYNTISGNLLTVFPIPNSPNNKWISPLAASKYDLNTSDSLFISQSLALYFEALNRAELDKNYEKADEILSKIKIFQTRYGYEVIPSTKLIKAEIVYNGLDVFKRLYAWYLCSGILLLVLWIIFMLRSNSRILAHVVLISKALVFLCFVLHSIGLITRAFISGHAPWSDAYETMIYIAWATMFFAIILARKSEMTLAAASFVVATILMVAHWNWLDPEIANLQPVLNSYWLMIHVAIIVASYGPFTLAMVLGFISLMMMLMVNKKNWGHMKSKIKKLSLTIEMTITVGVIMLTIGNFLGGQWANESWGRYWAWDPKETWALISIIIYAFIIHMRLIPGFKGEWWMATMSVVGFASILMTYFGVNFYLSGLHSYAKGEKIVTPNFVYYSVCCVVVVSSLAYFKYKKHLNTNNVKAKRLFVKPSLVRMDK